MSTDKSRIISKEETDSWLEEWQETMPKMDLTTLAHRYVMAIVVEPLGGYQEDDLITEDPDYNSKLLGIICKDKRRAKQLMETLFLDVAEQDELKKIVTQGCYWDVVQPLKQYLGA